MAQKVRALCDEIAHHAKDIIAYMVTLTWCVSIFLPETLIDEVTQRSFERIMLMILGFYFGSHRESKRQSDL